MSSGASGSRTGNMPPKRNAGAQVGNPSKKRSKKAAVPTKNTEVDTDVLPQTAVQTQPFQPPAVLPTVGPQVVNVDAGPLAPGTGAATWDGGDERLQNWKTFEFQTKDNKRKNKPMYYHWLPTTLEELLPEMIGPGEHPPAFYQEFDCLVHVTTMENAHSILKGGFRKQNVQDNSVINPSCKLFRFERGEEGIQLNKKTGSEITYRPSHPADSIEVLWYGPCTFRNLQNSENMFTRYGNVSFHLLNLTGYEGIDRRDLNLYFIEVIRYKKATACRILVSTKDYPSLKRLDPFEIGGPVYFNRGNYYYLSQLKCPDGEVLSNDVEFMKDFPMDANGVSSYLSTIIHAVNRNHCLSFSYCKSPRQNVQDLVVPLDSADSRNFVNPLSLVPSADRMKYLRRNILKLGIVLSFGKNKINLELRTPFNDTEERDRELRKELEEVHKEAEALQKPEVEINDRDLIKVNINRDIGMTLMSKRDIVESYYELLTLYPESKRSTLTDTLWEDIQKKLAPPK